MPDNSANRAAMRAAGHSIRAYASFIAPDPIATGTILTTPAYPSGGSSPFINVTYVTGAYTDVLEGMEMVISDTATGAFKARTHVRYGVAGSIVANSIPVREYSQASLNIAVGDTFKIYAEWRMHDKLAAAVNDFPPDFRFYADADAGDEPEPVANSGGDWAGMVDGYGTSSELTYATVLTKGDTSFTVYPTGGSITHLWTLPSGVNFAPGSSSTDANPTLRANVGTYVITHTVTDVASGRSRASHPSIRVHNGSNLPHRVLITSYEGTADDGWNWEIEIVAGAVDFTTIPDGCKCILWGRERINGAWQSFRNAAPGRSHILGVGYVSRDTSNGNGEDGAHRVSFEVISPLSRMKQIKSYSKVMLEDANPDSWSEITELGVLRGILQILQYYLMWCEAGFDTVVDPDLLDERYPTHFLDATNFYDQMMELAKAIDARMVVDRTGRLDIHTHPANIPLADRAAVTVALALADADILDYDFTREHAVKVVQMKVSGISGGATGNVPVFSLYPGAASGEGIDAPEIARLILDATSPQDDINARTGRYGALADMVFFDADGNKEQAFDLNLTLRGSYDCFDFYKEYIEVDIADNARGIDLSGRRFYLLNSSTDFDPDTGSTTTNLTLRMETNAAEGETYIPPDDTDPGGDGQPTPYEPPITTPTLPGVLGVGKLIVIDDNNQLFHTGDGNGASPVWAAEALSMTGDAGDFISDPFSPLYLSSGDLWLRVTTETHIYLLEVDTSDFSLSATDQKTLPSAGFGIRRIEMERGVPNFAVVISQYASSVKTCATTDGATWGSEVTVNSATGGYAVPGLFISPRTAGKVLTSENIAAGAYAGKVSTNYGASYATVTNPALGDADGQAWFAGHVPFHNNSAETIAYGGFQLSSENATWHRIYKIDGATRTDISPTFGGSEKFGAQFPRAIDTSPVNRLRLCAVLRNGHNQADANSDIIRVCYSLDGGSTWSYIAAMDATVGSGAWCNFVRALGDGSGFIAGGSGGRLFVCDWAGNYRDISVSASLSPGRLLNVVGF